MNKTAPATLFARRRAIGASAETTTSIAHDVVAALREWIGTLRLDSRTRYLSAATDHADLARRMAAWDERERSDVRGPL